MNCQACDGTGDGRKFGDRNCSICNGSGSVCDICGDAVEEGESVCNRCLEDDSANSAGSSAPACSAAFVITAKGPGLHRQFNGTATIKSGQASAATILLAMLHQIITQDGLTGDTSVTAKITLKPNDSGDGLQPATERHG